MSRSESQSLGMQDAFGPVARLCSRFVTKYLKGT